MISRDKRRIYLSKNVGIHLRNQISNGMGFVATLNIEKYLRVNIYYERVSRITFKEILSKAKTRLLNWKAKILSLAGRTTLVK